MDESGRESTKIDEHLYKKGSCGVRGFKNSPEKIKTTLKYWKYDFSQKQSISGELLKAPDLNSVIKKDNPFYGKKIVISGTYKTWSDRKELASLLKRNGAKICSNMGSGKARRDILCAGEGVGPRKIEIMNEMINNGNGGQILDEEKILDLISKFNLTWSSKKK